MGAADPIIPEDGEGPAREMTLTYDYFFDKYEVSNAEFYRFAYETGYVTEAEKFGDSFCFHLFIPEKTAEEIKLQVKETPWWLPVQELFDFDKIIILELYLQKKTIVERNKGADWLHPVGPESSLEGIWDHPVVHVSYNDAKAYCE